MSEPVAYRLLVEEALVLAQKLEAPLKEPSIESLRGLAIVLLVLFHATSATGLTSAGKPPSPWVTGIDQLCELLAPIRMPLFTVISGYVYALRPVSHAGVRSFIVGKARLLLLPLLSLSTITFLFKIGPGRSWWGTPELHLKDIWRVYIFSYDHFWFLQAIMIVFFVIVWLEHKTTLSTWRDWLVIQGLAGLLYLIWLLRLLPVPESTWRVLSLGGSIYLFPLFLLGLGLHRFPQHLQSRRAVVIAGLIFAITAVLIGLSQAGLSSLYWGKESLVGMIAGMSANLLLFRYRVVSPSLARLGLHSYSIYLLHHFGLIAGGGFAAWLGTDSLLGELLLRFGGGVLFPLGAWSLLRRVELTRVLILGLRPSTQRPVRLRPL